MGAAFDDAAAVEHQQQVGMADGAEAVGDDKAGAPPEQDAERMLDAHFGDGVDGTGGLVEDQDPRVSQQRARKADQLPLAKADAGTPLADRGAEPVWQRLQRLKAFQALQRLPHVCVRGGCPPHADVFDDRPGEQEVLLQDHAQLVAQVG